MEKRRRFKSLNLEERQFVRELFYSDTDFEERIRIGTERFNIHRRTLRRWWKKLNCSKYGHRNWPLHLKEAADREIGDDIDVILVTSAQNETIVNSEMIHNMQVYADFIQTEYNLKAKIVVIPARYKNPTTPREASEKRADEWWDLSVRNLLHYGKYRFGDTIIAADTRISPTAENPLRGFEAMAAENHLILGHSRLHLETLPRFKDQSLRVMCTTGYCTRKNYSVSKAGDKGYIHHSYGFVVIEKRKNGTCLPPRQVKVKSDGSFIDWKFSVGNGDVEVINSCAAYVYGDIHHREMNADKMASSQEIVDSLNPQKIVLHDVHDGSTVNPHEKDDLFIRKLKIKQGLHLVEEEVNESLIFLAEFHNRNDAEIVVVQSNHDDFIDKYINKTNWKDDLHNSDAYLKYAMIQQTVDLRKYGNIFGYLVNSTTDGKIRYIKNIESLQIKGYECGYHGEHGINGARGSINSFKRINVKMIVGHGHSPKLKDGVLMVGVSCNLWQYYNSKGLSSWAYADAIVHNNGKNQLIIFDDRDLRFTLLDGKAEEEGEDTTTES